MIDAAYEAPGRRPPALDAPSRMTCGARCALGRLGTWPAGRGGTEVGDLKIADAALAEMTEAFRVFRPYRSSAS